jgi:hypothetical protein
MMKIADGEDTQILAAVEPTKILSRKRKINGAFFVSGLGVPSVSRLTQSRCRCRNLPASD